MTEESNLKRFRDIIERLRHPVTGCPWDLKQTHDSLKRFFLEEVYEFLREVDKNEQEAMEEELGDVLLQIYLHSRLLEENSNGKINIETIAGRICDKMIRRHPHVFSDIEADTASQVEDNWQKIKAREKGGEDVPRSVFHKFKSDPPLRKVENIYREVKRSGFKFDTVSQAMDKVSEELAEVKEQIEENGDFLKEEMADLLMAVCSLAVELKFSPEELLLMSLNKFEGRWDKLHVCLEGRDMKALSYEEKLSLWEKAKSMGASE
jgi:tetrapyrrole methylase family protein/MazG family protein